MKDNAAKANVPPIFKRGVLCLYISTFCEISSLLSKTLNLMVFLLSERVERKAFNVLRKLNGPMQLCLLKDVLIFKEASEFGEKGDY